MKVAAIMVVYNVCKDWEWTQISVGSFRRHFPDHPLIVVDHNDNPAERAYLLGQGAVVLSAGSSTTHGAGMNRATYWCIQNGYDAIVHFEPDCLVSGRDWYDRLLEPLHDGKWMSAPNKMPFGALHPCPSAWLTSKVVGKSFDITLKGEDVNHPSYSELIDVRALIDMLQHWNVDHWNFWLYWWDTGFKNWFDIACQGKVAHVEGCHDLTHYYYGRHRKPFEIEDDRLREWLDWPKITYATIPVL